MLRVHLLNGEVVRLGSFSTATTAVISWIATPAGISGEMIGDMMVRCVEQRFGAIRALHAV